nr:putative reverse transcriptase domain-containing protein [Tanacetum cinerariifolium]
MGRVKDINSIANLRTLFTKEGFPSVKLSYLGGLWAMVELDHMDTKLNLLKHVGVKSWFHSLQEACPDFISDERIVWVDIEDNFGSSFARKRLCVRTKQPDSILEKFKVILKGKVLMVRAKELFTWNPIFLEPKVSDYTSRAGIFAKKEAPVNFLTDLLDGRSTLRLTGVLIFRWVGRKHACVDLTGVSPLVGLSSRGFTVGQTALKDAPCKVTKHEKACIENQHVFVPFAFDTFGFLAPEAVELLNIVQRVMHSNVMTLRSTNIDFKRISFAIQKWLAAQLVARLSYTTM